jgi:hypothetical protein
MRGSFHFPAAEKENMAKVVVYLREQELQALNELAEKEYRAPRAQAALILKAELERLGMLTSQPLPVVKEACHE